MPTGQDKQTDDVFAPTTELNEPEGHGEQTLDPGDDEYVPATQIVHTVALESE